MKRPDKYAEIKTRLTEIYHKHKGRYGYRRITLELRNSGILINHKTVQRLMKESGLRCMVRVKKYRSYKGEVGRIAPNIINRNFRAIKPNTKWVTDVTEFTLFGQKLYLSSILDLYNSEIISYSISRGPTFNLISEMLLKAFQKLSNSSKLVLHSDQGWQYQTKRYRQLLQKKDIIQSMSRKGNCLDNAVVENFFGILKSELLYLQKFDSVEHFISELHDYIYYYNNERIKAKLQGLSPVDFRTRSFIAA